MIGISSILTVLYVLIIFTVGVFLNSKIIIGLSLVYAFIKYVKIAFNGDSSLKH